MSKARFLTIVSVLVLVAAVEALHATDSTQLEGFGTFISNHQIHGDFKKDCEREHNRSSPNYGQCRRCRTFVYPDGRFGHAPSEERKRNGESITELSGVVWKTSSGYDWCRIKNPGGKNRTTTFYWDNGWRNH